MVYISINCVFIYRFKTAKTKIEQKTNEKLKIMWKIKQECKVVKYEKLDRRAQSTIQYESMNKQYQLLKIMN